MALSFDLIGQPDLPLLICVHGLLGGPENFSAMLPAWSKKFCPIVVDLHSHMRTGGLIQISEENMGHLTYDGAAEQTLEYLDREFPGRRCYFAGLSLGGKVAYKFAGCRPDLFAGAVITDVGPGSLSDSDLYQFVHRTVPSLNMNQAWADLKQELVQKVPDRNVRVMIQTQIHYPVKEGPAAWRAGMTGLKDLLSQQSLGDQWADLEAFAAHWRGEKPPSFIVYKASALSAISTSQLAAMRNYPFLDIRPVDGSSHFVHIPHRALIEAAVLSLHPSDSLFHTERNAEPSGVRSGGKYHGDR